jgi:hypothetical protein
LGVGLTAAASESEDESEELGGALPLVLPAFPFAFFCLRPASVAVLLLVVAFALDFLRLACSSSSSLLELESSLCAHALALWRKCAVAM